MQFEHLRYEKSGRTCRVLDYLGQDTGKLAFRSKVGEQQTFFNGEWSPYAVDGDRVLFGHHGSEIEFQSGRQVIKKAGARLIGSSRFFVERETFPGVWETVNHGPATRNLAHNYPEEGKLTGYLDFPSAPYDLQIGLTVGGRRDVKLGFRFRSPIAGRVRFVWINEDIDEFPGDGFELLEEGGDPRPRGGILPRKTIGLRFGNVKFRWTYAEADEREISVTNRGADRKDLSIIFGPFDVNAGEWLEVSPDTFGPVETNDDCEQAGTSYNDSHSGYLYVGYLNSKYYHNGWRWDSVTVPAGSTADDGCKVTIYSNYCGGGGTGNARLEIVDARSVTAWSSGYLPTDTTRHGATVTWNDPGGGTRNSPEIKTLIQARLDDDHQSNDDIAICWMETSNSNPGGSCGGDAEESGNGAALTIVYTPPWSSSISPSASPSLSPSASPSESPSISPSISPSVSPSESPSVSPSELATDYTKGAYETLPSDESELSTYYTQQQITDVGADNGTRVNQQAYGMYAIHQFIEDATGYTSATITWNGQSDLAPSTASVVLEIYNHNTTSWDQLDIDSSSSADTDFDLTANISDLTNYKDPGTDEITCRVYQLAPE